METKLEPRRLWKKRLNPTARKLANLTEIQFAAGILAGVGVPFIAIGISPWIPAMEIPTVQESLYFGLGFYVISLLVIRWIGRKLQPLELQQRQWIEAQGTLDKFVTDTKAVSPVLVMILMVAITVVLTATIFVLLSSIGAK